LIETALGIVGKVCHSPLWPVHHDQFILGQQRMTKASRTPTDRFLRVAAMLIGGKWSFCWKTVLPSPVIPAQAGIHLPVSDMAEIWR
jgi:hypothetical protein